jgi:hypothetical protein
MTSTAPLGITLQRLCCCTHVRRQSPDHVERSVAMQRCAAPSQSPEIAKLGTMGSTLLHPTTQASH